MPKPWLGPSQELISVPALRCRIAVIGRAQSYLYFWYHAAMLASIIALPSTKKVFTSWSRV